MPPHEHSYNIQKSTEMKLDLTGGGYTSFCLLRCECGHPLAFPKMNLDIAVASGTEDTIKTLKDLDLV